MVASDVAITKATRKTSLELLSLEIPTIAILTGANALDEKRVRFIPNTKCIRIKDFTGAGLVRAIDGLRNVAVGGVDNSSIGFENALRTISEVLALFR